MIKKTDRRVQKTRKALSEALIGLMLEKSYDAITIQEIIDRANVGRATFYMHYEGKEQLLLSGHMNLQVTLFEVTDGKVSDLMPLLAHISANRQLAKALLGEKAGAIMFSFFKNNLSQMFKKKYAAKFGKDSRSQRRLRYGAEAAAAAACSLLTSWIADDFFMPIAEFDSQCTKTVAAILGSN